MKYWSPERVKGFRERHARGKEERNQRMAALPFEEKLRLSALLNADVLAMKEARRHEGDRHNFGLGMLPDSAINYFEVKP